MGVGGTSIFEFVAAFAFPLSIEANCDVTIIEDSYVKMNQEELR